MNEIEQGLKDSVCKDCKRWIFYDWWLCDKAPEGKSDMGVLLLPIKECNNHELGVNEWLK